MIKCLSSFSPTFLLRACLIIVTICPLLHIHTLKKVARSFAHAPDAPDYQFHVAGRLSSDIGNLMTWLGRISNAASAIGMESNSTRLSSVLLYSNRTFTSVPSTASSLYPVSHPVTDIDFNQQRSKWW
ncbi:hypothetical protein B0H14DRAFT_2615710 [Mycena olivaceomarginata]|nr:hypothetical protein B0H14DRAFT_2615710 [Mycena olivaceomarginata]